jgi:hypothetical protein
MQIAQRPTYEQALAYVKEHTQVSWPESNGIMQAEQKDPARPHLLRVSYAEAGETTQNVFPNAEEWNNRYFWRNMVELAQWNQPAAIQERERVRIEAKRLSDEANAQHDALVAASPYLIVRLEFNWADEMDFAGFCPMTQAQYRSDVLEYVNGLQFPVHCSLGSNETQEWETAADLLADYRAEPITEEQYRVLHELFPHGYGTWPDFD